MIEKVIHQFFYCFPLMIKGLGLVLRAARGWTLAWGILLLLQGVIPAGQVYLTKLTVDRLAFTVPGRSVAVVVASAWPPIALIALLWIVSQLLSSLIRWVRAAQAELVQDHIHAIIHRQALALDVAFYENPESYDLLHRARVDAITQPLALLESLGVVLQNSITLLVLAGMLENYRRVVGERAG